MKTAEYKVTGFGPLHEVDNFRKSLITWAQNQATGQRTQAAIGHTKKHADKHNHKSESFDFMAKYLEGMEIKSE